MIILYYNVRSSRFKFKSGFLYKSLHIFQILPNQQERRYNFLFFKNLYVKVNNQALVLDT